MNEEKEVSHFLEEIIEADIRSGKHGGRVHTRFPPEPNGYLHMGHATSICLNFGLAKKYGGKCNLRFDDTNPLTEETEYVESIKADIRWLGFEWDGEYYTSDYFDQLFEMALDLIRQGKAYVDDQSSEQMAAQKGSLYEPGKPSPYRDRTPELNEKLFREMKEGRYEEGEKVLRAKIDMAHPNLLMRDPLLYRIKKASHHRTGDRWCIYPMYDFAHGQSDSIEKITHSFCTLEFAPHRPLYDWLIENLKIFPSRQYEFARRNLSYMVMSKRRLLELVQGKYVNGWDDPRMPTISGMRRRGYTPASIRQFCEKVGVSKRENLTDISLLEHCVREDLNETAPRAMAVLDPIPLIITNYPEGEEEWVEGENNPQDAEAGHRSIPFSRNLWMEREDFMEDPPRKFFRLGPGRKVRLKHAYIIECTGFTKDSQGNITAVHAEYVPESRSGSDSSGLTVKGTIHWVSQKHALEAEVREYDRLFTVEDPGGAKGDFKDYINPDSLHLRHPVYLEPSLGQAQPGDRFQFLRKGYFVLDADSQPGRPVFNLTVGLKDTWAKEKKKAGQGS